MSPRLLPLLTLLLLLSACQGDPVQKDDDIPASIRATIDSLNLRVIDGFATQNPGKVLSVCSKDLAAQSENELYSLIIAVGRRLKHEKFHIKNRFLIKNESENAETNAATNTKSDHDYTLTYTSVNKESFVSVGYFEDSVQTLCLTTIYGKYDDRWQLNILQIGTLELMRQDAIDWYAKAKQHFGKGHLVDAANALSLCAVVLQPASKYWRYEKVDEITAFGEQLKAEAKKQFAFPLTVPAVPSAPKIFQVSPEGTGSGFLPMVLYTTSLNMADTAALSAECTAIHAHIGELFKGLDQNNKWILYRAYEKVPEGTDTVRNHGFVRAAAVR